MIEQNMPPKHYVDYLYALLFFMMLAFPVTLQTVKVLVMVVIIAYNFIRFMKYKVPISETVNLFMILFLSYSVLGSLIGFFNQNPGVSGFFRLNVVYYILLYCVILGFRNKGRFSIIIKAIVAASNFIGVYTLALIAYIGGHWPFPFFYIIDDTSNVGFHEGYIHATNTNLSMLIFIFPLLALLMTSKQKVENLNRTHLISTVVFAALIMIISGRRIMWIILAATILLIVLRKGVGLKNRIKYFVMMIVFIAISLSIVNFYYPLSLDSFTERFNYAFSKIDEYGNENVRNVQAEHLFAGFTELPFLGSGVGVGVPGSVRSKSHPWMYEQSYSLILYNSGLIGIVLYFGSMIVIMIALYKSYKTGDEYSYSLFFAFVSSLIANATNPYLSGSFDFLIMVFIPLLYINCLQYDNSSVKSLDYIESH